MESSVTAKLKADQSGSQPPFPQQPSSADLSGDLHRAAKFAGQSKFFLDQALRTARNGRVRRVLGTLIDAQQAAVESLERLKSGAAGAL